MNHDLAAVLDKVDGKSVSHMAETDHTDTSDDECGGSARLGHGFGGSNGVVD
jgi:hypothetical protein